MQKNKFILIQLWKILPKKCQLFSIISLGTGFVSSTFDILTIYSIKELTDKANSAINISYLGINLNLNEAIILTSILILLNSGSKSIFLRTSTYTSTAIGNYLSEKAFSAYCSFNYNTLMKLKHSEITSLLATQVNQVISYIIKPFFDLSGALMSILMIIIFLYLNNPLMASIALVMMLKAYSLPAIVFRKEIKRIGNKLEREQIELLEYIERVFGDYTNLLLTGYTKIKKDKFTSIDKEIKYCQAKTIIFSSEPRIIIEAVIFSLIMAVIFLDDANNIQLLVLFGLSSIKLLPNFQKVYSAYISYKTFKPALNTLLKLTCN